MDVSLVIGLIAFSYGLEAVEPSICNRTLAANVVDIWDKEPENVLVVAQWEVALALPSSFDAHVVRPRYDGYLSSRDVVEEAKNYFKTRGVTNVIPVAQPFLQLRAVCGHLAAAGLKVERRPLRRIGHNPQRTSASSLRREAEAVWPSR